MFCVMINDCLDPNARGRQEIRLASVMHAPQIFIGVKNDIEASGNLIDAIDAAGGREGVILVNVSPRSGEAKKKWPNGSPFARFTVESTTVYASVDGYTLSLAKKLGLITDLELYDVPTVIQIMTMANALIPAEGERIVKSQFRSFEFLPRLVEWEIGQKLMLPSEIYPLEHIPDIPKIIWLVDSFGNCKTSILPEDINFGRRKYLKTGFGILPCYHRLSEVPDDEASIIIGSSGFREHRFLEIVVQGGSSAERLAVNIKSGATVLP